MTKEALINQAAKAWFLIAAANFAGYVDDNSQAQQDYNKALTKLTHNYGMTQSELREILISTRIASFYDDFARQVLGANAIKVAA